MVAGIVLAGAVATGKVEGIEYNSATEEEVEWPCP